MPVRQTIRRILRPAVIAFAIIYFVIDALFLVLLKPVAVALSKLAISERIQRWIGRLGPYPTLVLFLIPLAIFEPVKPVGAYLIASGHVLIGVSFIAIGEILKIVIVERLFHMCRGKLMSIRAFAWSYKFVMRWLDYLKSLPVWQAMVAREREIRTLGRKILAAMRKYLH